MNSEPTPPDASKVPTYSPELGTRIALVIDQLGGLKKAAELVGYKPEQLARWRDGVSRPPLLACAGLVHVAGKSLDWLVLGREDTAGLDPRLVQDVLATLVEYLEERGLRTRSYDDFGKLAIALCHLVKEEKARRDGKLDLDRFGSVVGLATQPVKSPPKE